MTQLPHRDRAVGRHCCSLAPGRQYVTAADVDDGDARTIVYIPAFDVQQERAARLLEVLDKTRERLTRRVRHCLVHDRRLHLQTFGQRTQLLQAAYLLCKASVSCSNLTICVCGDDGFVVSYLSHLNANVLCLCGRLINVLFRRTFCIPTTGLCLA